MGEYTKLVKKMLESASHLHFDGKRFGYTRHTRKKKRGRDKKVDGFYNPK